MGTLNREQLEALLLLSSGPATFWKDGCIYRKGVVGVSFLITLGVQNLNGLIGYGLIQPMTRPRQDDQLAYSISKRGQRIADEILIRSGITTLEGKSGKGTDSVNSASE